MLLTSALRRQLLLFFFARVAKNGHSHGPSDKIGICKIRMFEIEIQVSVSLQFETTPAVFSLWAKSCTS